jgi:hypothetical protein
MVQRAAAAQGLDNLVLVAAQAVLESVRALLKRRRGQEEEGVPREGTLVRITAFARRSRFPRRAGAQREEHHEPYPRPGFDGASSRHGEPPRYSS